MSKWFHRSRKEPILYAPPPGPPPPQFTTAPPEWSAAAEPSYNWGLKNEAPEAEYEAAESFCNHYPPEPPKFLDSRLVDQIRDERASAWQIEPPSSSRFRGSVRNNKGTICIETEARCQDVCLLSNLPLLAGHYSRQGQSGVYYEIVVDRMDSDAVVALGTNILYHRSGTLNKSTQGRLVDHTRNGASQGGTDLALACTSTTCASFSRIPTGDAITQAPKATSSIFRTVTPLALVTSSPQETYSSRGTAADYHQHSSGSIFPRDTTGRGLTFMLR